MTDEVKTTTRAAKTKVAHIHTALANILRALSVDKNGQLPSNMGGKPYIAAVDVAKESKRLFVENNVRLDSSEDVQNIEIISGKTHILIKGTYTATSTEDGSSVTFSGIGDGMSTGSVASNIASTNAFKNAFLREFMITEQSVEDEAKNPTEVKENPKVAQAKKTVAGAVATARSVSNAGPSQEDPRVAVLKERIRAEFVPKLGSNPVNAKWAEVTEKLGKPKASVEVLTELVKTLEAA